MYPSNLRKFISNNVLTTAEAAELLQVTKQRIINMVKAEEILPIKQTTQGMLFLRADIDSYKKKRDYGVDENLFDNKSTLFDHSGSTQRSISFYKENISKLGEISAIFIFFDKYDAALDNFYIPSEDERYGDLRFIDVPHMIIRDITGKELWLGGCNCGYGGEGPHGSISILKKLREDSHIIINDKDIEEIKYNRIVKLFKDPDGSFEFIAHNSLVESYQNYNSVDLDLYFFRGNLVLIQDTHSMWNKSDISDLERYRDFIPNPTQVKIFNTYNQARYEGYVKPGKGFEEEVYRLIIFDSSGRQIWLNPLIDDTKPLYYQNNLVEILSYCGFDIKSEKLAERLQRWIKTNVRKVPIEPIVYKK